MKADLLREKFLSFFKSKKHKVVESDSLIPKDDPTVLFTPAGMNQFKKEFLGLVGDFRRAATAQRCLRTDDLDKVGKTSGHHTFFEMLGNFSFGDYFKEEAIAYAWEFLAEELNITKEKLWVSVYKDDEEAYKIWKDKIKIPESRIIKLGDKENFWPSEAKEKGPNGPCGPCSEIFFDHGKDIGCGKPDCNPACGCGRFVEVWNLVFTQFNRKEGGILEPLPQKNIDTGMGLERLAAVMQGVKNNFETELFKPVIEEIASSAVRSPSDESLHAVADHLRAIIFAIYDGVLPSNDGRGYVVRKLIRKSALHLNNLGIKEPFLFKLVPVLSEVMRSPYPELDRRKENIAEIILTEERNFISALTSSEALFKEKFEALAKKQDPDMAGRIAFKLYDTYGIPLELTKEWLARNKIGISQSAYQAELSEQKTRSKSQSAMKGDVFGIKELHLGGRKTSFLGYRKYEVRAKAIKIIRDNAEVKKIIKGEEAKIILDKTVFYPESGGQIGDSGEFLKGKSSFKVIDTQRLDKIIIHTGIVKEGSFKTGDELKALVDVERRLAVARNHTATHLLQGVLRKVLGNHVQQQGSLVAEDKLRFDFRHFKALDAEQLKRIEEIVNEYIINNDCLSTKELALSAAKKSGALAFFGEKYEGKVRVVSIGGFSKELCAGTHLIATGQIGLFKIIQEGSVASGVRRIEAATGKAAYKAIKEEEEIVAGVSLSLGVPKDKIIQELDKRLNKIKELEKRLTSQRLDISRSNIDELLRNAEIISGIKVITDVSSDLNMDLLRKTVDLIKGKTSSAIISLGSSFEGRAMLVIGVTPDLCAKGVDASRLIRDVALIIGGSGGGRKDFAQAGGNKPQDLKNAFQELKKIISQIKL